MYSVYCLCVNVCCANATGCQLSCSSIYIISYVVTVVVQQNRTEIVKPCCQTNDQSPFSQELQLYINAALAVHIISLLLRYYCYVQLIFMARDQNLQVTSCSGRLRLEKRQVSRRCTDSLVFVFSCLQVERLRLKCDTVIQMFSEFTVIRHNITCRANKTLLKRLKEKTVLGGCEFVVPRTGKWKYSAIVESYRSEEEIRGCSAAASVRWSRYELCTFTGTVRYYTKPEDVKEVTALNALHITHSIHLRCAQGGDSE
jgi:hypothetical protein